MNTELIIPPVYTGHKDIAFWSPYNESDGGQHPRQSSFCVKPFSKVHLKGLLPKPMPMRFRQYELIESSWYYQVKVCLVWNLLFCVSPNSCFPVRDAKPLFCTNYIQFYWYMIFTHVIFPTKFISCKKTLFWLKFIRFCKFEFKS